MSVSRRVVEHPIFTSSCRGLQDMLSLARPGFIGRLCGPTGCGKSEIAIRVAQLIAGDSSKWGPGKLPIAFARAAKVDRGRFNQKHFVLRVHMAIASPDLRWMRPNEAGLADACEKNYKAAESREIWLDLRARSTEGEIFDSVEELVRARGVRYLIFEDANAMTAVTRHEHPAAYMQPWVSLAENAGIVILFCGTPSMLELWDGEQEAERRATTIFVPRYRIDSDDERRAFASLLRSIATEYTWQSGYKVVADAKFVFLVTMGVYGQIQALFDRARNWSVMAGHEGISRAAIQASGPPPDKLKSLMRSVLAFESKITPIDVVRASALYDEVYKEFPQVD